MEYGYIRVSTKEQNEGRQLAAMATFGISEKNLFIDKQSGKDFLRPAYQRLFRRLKAGDILVLGSIDRLGRNYDDIIEQWRIITKEKRAHIVVLDMPLLDTRQQGRDLTGTFIADLVLQILSYVAQTERENIRKRQAEGIAAAKAKGVHLGRPRKPLPPNFAEACAAYEQHAYSTRKAAAALGVSRSTFVRWYNTRREPLRPL